MNGSEYGNTPWDVYVYGSYLFVALCLFVYALKDFWSLKKTLIHLEEEGFLSPIESTEKNDQAS